MQTVHKMLQILATLSVVLLLFLLSWPTLELYPYQCVGADLVHSSFHGCIRSHFLQVPHCPREPDVDPPHDVGEGDAGPQARVDVVHGGSVEGDL